MDVDLLPPLLYASEDRPERRWQAGLVKAKRIRRIGPRLYASIPAAKVPDLVRASWANIVSALFPDALISHRTALEYKPSPRGEVILTATTNRVVKYPGLALRFARGPGPLPDDATFLGVRASSRARAFLENLSVPRGKPRTLARADLEERLEQILQVEGEGALNELRDRARAIATRFGWNAEAQRLDAIIGALLGTRTEALASPRARARAAGEPYDAHCLERLQALFAELRTRPIPDERDEHRARDDARNKAFFEAYFSNYIEGTTFEIDEAERIIFDREIPARRPADAHDILGTFRIVSDPAEMRRVPADYGQLRTLLQSRHATLMAERPAAEPGRFKHRPNRAGDTHFVAPAYVVGTLRQGLALHHELAPGLPRAIFMMFLVADVHPFVDGNGRVARIMMNAELHAAKRSTIIIPNAFRDDYLTALRALTRRHRPRPLVDVLVRAQHISTRAFAPYPAALRELERLGWFREPDDGRIDLSSVR